MCNESENNLGKMVCAYMLDGRLHGCGKVVAYSVGTQYRIERSDGTSFWWQQDLCDVGDIYKSGSVLERTIFPVYVLVCAEDMGQSADQFRAVVLFCDDTSYFPGEIIDDWNKDYWMLSSFAAVAKHISSVSMAS